MSNADRLATRIVSDEYRISDAEALEHIIAIVRRGEEDALSQIGGILAESGRVLDDVVDDTSDGYDPDTGEFNDFNEGDSVDALGGGLSLVDACLNGILKPKL